MALLPGKKLRSVGAHGQEGTYGYTFICPGCDSCHLIYTVASPHPDHKWPVWGFNNNFERPTFTPSLLVQWDSHEPPVTPENHEQYLKAPWEQHKVHHVCHSFITDGRIQFLGDCTHALKGQTVEIPEHDDAS